MGCGSSPAGWLGLRLKGGNGCHGKGGPGGDGTCLSGASASVGKLQEGNDAERNPLVDNFCSSPCLQYQL